MIRCMSKTFRDYSPDQQLLLPPSLRDWLPEGHLALFISDVVDALDLSAIFASYEKGDGRGMPPHHPAMMTKVLLFAYCTGKPSSRRIERATYEEVPYRVLAANQQPDHDSIAAFRKRHLPALAGLFVQVLEMARQMGLVKLGHVALDGTKVKANASKHKAMSYQRMCETEQRLVKEVEALLAAAEQADAETTPSTARASGATNYRPRCSAENRGSRRFARPRLPLNSRPRNAPRPRRLKSRASSMSVRPRKPRRARRRQAANRRCPTPEQPRRGPRSSATSRTRIRASWSTVPARASSSATTRRRR
jgi:transposase